MTDLYLKFDFPDLEPHHALWLLTNDLQADAYYLENGRPVGIRNVELAAQFIDLRRQALVGICQERIAAFKKGQTCDPEEEKAELGKNAAADDRTPSTPGKRGASIILAKQE